MISDILAASVHSGWDERKMEDALFTKIVLDNKKPRKKPSVKNVDLW